MVKISLPLPRNLIIVLVIVVYPVCPAGKTSMEEENKPGIEEPRTPDNADTTNPNIRPVANLESRMAYTRALEEMECLALNIYFEARSEPDMGRRAVGHVVMNRVNHSRFPDSACDVVHQGGYQELNRCQFSWWCDGRPDKPHNQAQWFKSLKLAMEIYFGYSEDPTGGALWYHADYTNPDWRKDFQRARKIGRHIFYRESRPRTNIL
jgi:spore germination cell wall hydrolase CwlJ-like protein